MKGIRGAKKYPVRLANMIGTKKEKPVMVDNKIVVLIGVRVTQELMAAIQLTMARGRLTDGKTIWMISPNAAPEKNKGMMNPPLQPEVTVTEMARILNTRIPRRA